jgi:hypothetical protein
MRLLCFCFCVCLLQLDSWSVGALAYDVLCGRAPFAEREDISRDDEKHNILNKVRNGGGAGGKGVDVAACMLQRTICHVCRKTWGVGAQGGILLPLIDRLLLSHVAELAAAAQHLACWYVSSTVGSHLSLRYRCVKGL